MQLSLQHRPAVSFGWPSLRCKDWVLPSISGQTISTFESSLSILVEGQLEKQNCPKPEEDEEEVFAGSVAFDHLEGKERDEASPLYFCPCGITSEVWVQKFNVVTHFKKTSCIIFKNITHSKKITHSKERHHAIQKTVKSSRIQNETSSILKTSCIQKEMGPYVQRHARRVAPPCRPPTPFMPHTKK